MSPSAESATKGATGYCAKCAGLHTVDLFEDIRGYPQRHCYVWQIVAKVLDAVKTHEDPQTRILEAKSMAKAELLAYRDAMRKRNPGLNLGLLENEYTLMRYVTEALKKLCRADPNMGKRTEQPRLTTQNLSPHDNYPPAASNLRREDSQTSASVSSPEASEPTINPVILSSEVPSRPPSLGPVDSVIQHLAQDRCNPTNEHVNGQSNQRTESSTAVGTGKQGAQPPNSHSKGSIDNSRDESHTAEPRPTPAPVYPPRNCGTCNMQRHNVYFWSHKKRDGEVLDCMFCRVRHRVLHHFRTKGAGKSEDDREEIVGSAKVAGVEFIEGWKNFIISKEVWTQEELDPLFHSVSHTIDSTVDGVSEDVQFYTPPKRIRPVHKPTTSTTKRKAATSDKDDSRQREPDRLTKVARARKNSTNDAAPPKALSLAAKTYIELPSEDEDEPLENNSRAASSQKSQKKDSPRKQVSFRDTSESSVKKHFTPIRERFLRGLKLLDKVESFDSTAYSKITLGEKSIKSRDDMVEKLDGLIRSLNTRIQIYEWDDSY